MNHTPDRDGGDWLDNLDIIMAGDAPPLEEDEELLHVATRLASALAPLRESARTAATNVLQVRPPMLFRQSRRGPQTRKYLLFVRLSAVAILSLLSLTCISTIGVKTLAHDAHQVLRISTSLDQINDISIASLAQPHAGLKPLPLLPTVLPTNTQESTYGVLTDTSNPNTMTTFVADYHINWQDVQLFEQPSDVGIPSTTAQTVHIGTRQGQLFQNGAGEYALQWYQNNMLCQLTGKLPVVLLIQLASFFQPVKSWDLIR